MLPRDLPSSTYIHGRLAWLPAACTLQERSSANREQRCTHGDDFVQQCIQSLFCKKKTKTPSLFLDFLFTLLSPLPKHKYYGGGKGCDHCDTSKEPLYSPQQYGHTTSQLYTATFFRARPMLIQIQYIQSPHKRGRGELVVSQTNTTESIPATNVARTMPGERNRAYRGRRCRAFQRGPRDCPQGRRGPREKIREPPPYPARPCSLHRQSTNKSTATYSPSKN
ncbi:unnamed protein product [Ectocarpus fasciculatus]